MQIIPGDDTSRRGKHPITIKLGRHKVDHQHKQGHVLRIYVYFYENLTLQEVGEADQTSMKNLKDINKCKIGHRIH